MIYHIGYVDVGKALVLTSTNGVISACQVS
jgi:hypothetical protein